MSSARLLALPAALALAAPVAATVGDSCAALTHGSADRRAEAVPAGTQVTSPYGGPSMTLPAYCKVTGTLRPVPGSRIGYQLWLPRPAAWTGRYQMLGNGGYSSQLPLTAMAAALLRGSAAIATDTGHDGDDPAFAKDRPQTIVDWGWRAVHQTALAGAALTRRYYGRAPTHRYFNGCSTGGHQAMMEAQRFPRDFDGIVAGAPGADRVRLNAAFLWQYLSNHPRGDDAHPILDKSDLALLQDHALAQCRSANGGAAGGLASDRWLDDPFACRPDPEALACRAGETRACLTPEKVKAARAMYDGARDPRTGARLTFPWLPGSERGWSSYWADPADAARPARASFWRVWVHDDPSWNWWSFRATRDLPAAQAKLSATIDTVNPDLTTFRTGGGRLLQYHGLADPVVSPLDTLAKRRAMAARQSLASWYRLFLVPGMGHCGGGDGFTDFDAQAAIERWVEQGRAPERLIAAAKGGGTRPLCAYPAAAVYRSGDPARASSFVCTIPTKRSL